MTSSGRGSAAPAAEPPADAAAPQSEYDWVHNYHHKYSDGLTVVLRNNKWGYIDTTGTEVIPCRYDEAESFSDGTAEVELDGETIKIDRTGTRVFY